VHFPSLAEYLLGTEKAAEISDCGFEDEIKIQLFGPGS
jgi:hypothetical protein